MTIEYHDPERLKVLYNVRIRENEQLRNEVERLKKEADLQKVEMTNLLKQTQSRLDKMTESHDEIQSILS